MTFQLNLSVAEPTTEFLHQQAIKLAFDDQLDASRAILQSILDRDPDNYPVYRDYTVHTAWSGLCTTALQLYAKIQQNEHQEAYLVTAMADCIAEKNSLAKSISMLEFWANRYPQDTDIANALQDKRQTLALRLRPWVAFDISANNADVPNRPQAAAANVFETAYNIRYTQPLGETLQLHGRYLTISSNDQIATRNMQRIGIGVDYAITSRLSLGEDLSQDTDGAHAGSLTTLRFRPRPTLGLELQHASYSEEIPLRALPKQTKTPKTSLSASFHTPNYQYEWFGSVSSYRFQTPGQENNKRKAIATDLSYGFEMGDRREQRVAFEIYYSSNSNDDPRIPYFNPKRDLSYAVAYKLDYVFRSKFRRHVDHFSVFMGIHDQQAYDYDPIVDNETDFNDPVYGLSYAQEYEFNQKTSFKIGASYASSVYDGQREKQYKFHIAVNRKL